MHGGRPAAPGLPIYFLEDFNMPMFVYHADCVGQETNCLYRHRVEITDEASLLEAVCHDYVCAEYRDGYRSKENFISSNCLAADFDNDHS